MKKWIKKSFHRQLLFCFAVVALFPLLLFGVSLIQTMETKINSDYEKRVTEQAEQIDAGVLHLFKNFEETVESINANSKIVGQINEEDSWSKSKIYLQFYREVSGLREYAQFDLYDKTGKCIYTTAQGNAGTDLPVYWGILKAVEESEENLVLRRAEPNDKDILMYAAGKLLGKENTLEGYIVIGMRAENFEKLLYDNGNSKAEVAFLDTYWRTIFESGNLQTDKIREELMKGHKLLGGLSCGRIVDRTFGKYRIIYGNGMSKCIFHGSTEFHVQCTYRNADHQCFIVCRCGIPCRQKYDPSHRTDEYCHAYFAGGRPDCKDRFRQRR